MRALRTFTAFVVAGFALSGCASQSDFDDLEADYQQLKAELRNWAEDTGNDPLYVSIEEWQQWTKNVVCDVVAKNPPTSPYTTGPGSTGEYCGGGDPNGDPEDPPPFGS